MVQRTGDGLRISLRGFEPRHVPGSNVTTISIYRALQECCRNKDLNAGRRLYCLVTQNSWESLAPLADPIIRIFASFGSLPDIRKAFSHVSNPTIYTWTALISAFVDLGEPDMAIQLHQRMVGSEISSDRVIFLAVLKACSHMGFLRYGRLVNFQVIDSGFENDVIVGNTLVDMYAKCNSLDEAILLFHSLPQHTLVSWSALIAGYAQHGYGDAAFECFLDMQNDGLVPCKDMFLCILKACSSAEAVSQGMEIHDQVVQKGYESDVLIGSSLIDFYSKCHCLEAAQKIFEVLPKRNVVSWGALITGYAQHGHGSMALERFEEMQKEGVQPGEFLLSTMLKLYAVVGASEKGKQLYEKILKDGCRIDTAVGNALIDLYCKCGNLEMAHRVLNELPVKDMASWGTIIAGYAAQGMCQQAVRCLESMVKDGFKPDGGILLNVLAACSRAGMLEDGWHLFQAMVNDYKLVPTIEHYNCIIDLFIRFGRLPEAADLFCTTSSTPDMIGWRSMLTGCRTFKNMDLGQHCFFGG